MPANPNFRTFADLFQVGEVWRHRELGFRAHIVEVLGEGQFRLKSLANNPNELEVGNSVEGVWTSTDLLCFFVHIESNRQSRYTQLSDDPFGD